MKIRIISVIAMTLLMMASQSVQAMFLWRKIPRIVKAGAGLGTAVYLYDRYQQDTLDIVDVSTPSNPTVLDYDVKYPQLSQDIDWNQESITKLHLTKVEYASAYDAHSYSYAAFINDVLLFRYWVTNSELRSKIRSWAEHLSAHEREQRVAGNLTMVHGTNQGATILFRTILDEVLNDTCHQNYVKLRNDTTLTDLETYHNVHEFYDKQIEQVPETVVYQMAHGGFGVSEVVGKDELVLFDHDPHVRPYLLSANLGLFGPSDAWIKESSLEFIITPCSWSYKCQNLRLLVKLLKHPSWIYQQVATNGIECLKYPSVLIEKCGKEDDEAVDRIKEIFDVHGVGDDYSCYKQELQHYSNVLNAGLIHVSLPEEMAQRWCYLSAQFGLRLGRESIQKVMNMTELDHGLHCYLSDQVRLLMHPEVNRSESISMQMYFLGDQQEIKQTIGRMYEIAHEIKDTIS